MQQNSFAYKYEQLPLPVVVYDTRTLSVLYANTEARLMLERTIPEGAPLEDILCTGIRTYEKLKTILKEPVGALFNLSAKTGLGQELQLTVSSSPAEIPAHPESAILYLHGRATLQPSSDMTSTQVQDFLTQISKNLYNSSDTDIIIKGMLSMVGNFVNVDRVYVFEESSGYFTNTYEWSSPQGKSRINNRRVLSVSSKTWVAIQNDLFISNDLSDIPPEDREYLVEQGVRSVAILPLFNSSAPIGFIGFEQHQRQRTWGYEEIQLLQIIAGIVVQLLLKKHAITETEEYQKVIQTVLDNVESPIYVSEFDSYKVLFTNRRMREVVAHYTHNSEDSYQGKLCWQSLQKDQESPCAFCPMPSPLDKDGNLTEPRRWEFKNPFDNRWYLMRNFAIKWVDNRYVHMSIATEITDLKEKEANLREFASKDRMTGIFNREWGHLLIQEAVNEIRNGGATSSLCFFDLDGLKKTNDTYGHNEGDAMLINFVNTVKEFTRRSDIFCRWGGDEFLLLLSDCMEVNAIKVITKIQSKVDQINEKGLHPFQIAFSHGIREIAPGEKEELDVIISTADERMYVDKMSKRQSYSFPE